jgi:hypothetical protein
VAAAQIHDRQKAHAELVEHLLLERVHQRVVEHGDLVRGVLVHVARGEDREFREELRQFLRRGDGHLEVAAADRLEFGALRKQRRVVGRLVAGELGHGGPEDLGHRDGALVGLGAGHRQAQLHPVVLGEGCSAGAGHKPEGGDGGNGRTAAEFGDHLVLPW